MDCNGIVGRARGGPSERNKQRNEQEHENQRVTLHIVSVLGQSLRREAGSAGFQAYVFPSRNTPTQKPPRPGPSFHKIHGYRHIQFRYYLTGLKFCARNRAKHRSCSLLALAFRHVRDRQHLRNCRRLSGRLCLSGAGPCLRQRANRQRRSFGVRAAAGNWTSAWQTLPPILAYMCGVAVGRLLRVRPQKHTFRATLICQALELLVLVALLFFGRLVPDLCAVPLIAFSAALQNTSFSNIGPWQFNSAMTTSNLRNAVSGWVQLALGETDPELRGEAIVGSVILLCFVAGALLGGVCTLHLPAYSLLPCVLLVAAGTLLTIRERERRLR